MPFDVFLVTGFEHPHEARMFDELTRVLDPLLSPSDEPSCLIGNLFIEGHSLDALFIKPGCVCVVEMKDYGGKIHFSENTEWTANGRAVRAGAKINPFIQTRAYKFAVGEFLQRHWRQIISPDRKITWTHVLAMVLFGQPIEFTETLPRKIGSWFHICDMDLAGTILPSMAIPAMDLTAEETQRLISVFDLMPSQKYSAGCNSPTLPEPQRNIPPRRRSRVLYHRESGLRERQAEFRRRGGARSHAAERLAQWLWDAARGVNRFLEAAARTDPRVSSSRIYQLNEACSLVCLAAAEDLYPFYLGTNEEVDEWLEANRGLVLTVDADSTRIVPTLVRSDNLAPERGPAIPTAENIPYLTRVEGLELETLVAQPLVRRHLAQLDEESTELEIAEALESIISEDARSFISEVLELVRTGDLIRAQARIRLRNGQACPVEDAPGLADAGLEGDANADQVLVINSESPPDIDRLLDPQNFQDWMLFLHPDQKRFAHGDYPGPMILTGVSGSGKTCILVHRARYLARKYPGERIGIMTLNRSLAGLLENLVAQLCTEDERRNISVHAFYDYFLGLIQVLKPERYFQQLQDLAPDSQRLRDAIEIARDRPDFGAELERKTGENAENTWDEFYDSHNPEVVDWLADIRKHLEEYRLDASRYLREECTLVRSGLALTERNHYLDGERFRRQGRIIPLQASHRSDLLKVLLLFEEWMLHGAVIDAVELTQVLTPMWKELSKLAPEHRFRCLLIDEFQDLSTLDLRLLMHVPLGRENGLFLAGDTVQRILVKRLELAAAGLGRGNAAVHSIRKNYRNSRQILKAASKLANDYASLAANQGEEIDFLDPELAQRETSPPIVIHTDHSIGKAWELALECVRGDGTSQWTVCIATVSPETISVDQILEYAPEGIQASSLSGDCIKHPEQMVVGTIHDLKGFEFRLVVLVGLESDWFPDKGVPADETWRDALRLYVAMTRARDQVYLLYGSEPSIFITAMGDAVVHRDEPVIRPPVRRARPGAPPTHHAPTALAPERRLALAGMDPKESAWDWFSDLEREALGMYFSKFVYRDGMTFRGWLTVGNLARLKLRLLRQLRRVSPSQIERITGILVDRGILPPQT